MRVAFIFLLYLCFHLPDGFGFSNAKICSQKSGTAATTSLNETSGSETVKSCLVIDHAEKSLETDYLVFYEDDDEEEFSDKKNFTTYSYFDTFSYTNNPRPHFGCSAQYLFNPRYVNSTSSRKFIEQRVLRL